MSYNLKQNNIFFFYLTSSHTSIPMTTTYGKSNFLTQVVKDQGIIVIVSISSNADFDISKVV